MHHAPCSGDARAAVLYVHPWAEEMNKARRMVALQARALARAGYAVLQVDLHGCGDSSGDLRDASWDGWIEDVVRAARWLRGRHRVPLVLWGLRTGALIAARSLQALDEGHSLLLWQPVTSGKVALQQFLRLRAAADLGQADGKGTLQRMRAELEAGQTVEIAGYGLTAALALALEREQLRLPDRKVAVAWLEVSTRADATLLPASRTLVDNWRLQGHAIAEQVVCGPAFWQTQEIEDAPALIPATLATMQDLHTEAGA